MTSLTPFERAFNARGADRTSFDPIADLAGRLCDSAPEAPSAAAGLIVSGSASAWGLWLAGGPSTPPLLRPPSMQRPRSSRAGPTAVALFDWPSFEPAEDHQAGDRARQRAEREIGRIREVPETRMAEADRRFGLPALHTGPIGSRFEYLRVRGARSRKSGLRPVACRWPAEPWPCNRVPRARRSCCSKKRWHMNTNLAVSAMIGTPGR
jgi:hypothetical protein